MPNCDVCGRPIEGAPLVIELYSAPAGPREPGRPRADPDLKQARREHVTVCRRDQHAPLLDPLGMATLILAGIVGLAVVLQTAPALAGLRVALNGLAMAGGILLVIGVPLLLWKAIFAALTPTGEYVAARLSTKYPGQRFFTQRVYDRLQGASDEGRPGPTK